MPTKQKYLNLGQRISDLLKSNITEEVQKDNDYNILLKSNLTLCGEEVQDLTCRLKGECSTWQLHLVFTS